MEVEVEVGTVEGNEVGGVDSDEDDDVDSNNDLEYVTQRC